MTKGKGKGYHEDPGPEGVAPKHRKAALEATRKSRSDLSNVEVKPAKGKESERYMKLHKDFGIEKEDAKLIEAEVGSKITDMDERNWGNGIRVKEYTFKNEEEWLIFDNEDSAIKAATSRVEEDVEDNPEWFPDWILFDSLNKEQTEYRFREMYNELNQSYVDDIEDEDNNEFTNRLASEMHERDIITYEEATDEDFDLDDKKEKMVEEMTNEQIADGNYGFDYYKFSFGDVAAGKLLKDWNLVDTREVADYVVSTDGIGHILSGYDGLQVDLDNEMVMYRTD